jgi:hypothetical protein
LHNIQPSPVKLGNLTLLLKAFELQTEFDDIIQGFQHGFRLGHTGPRTTILKNSRIPPITLAKEKLEEYISREIGIGRLIGPLSRGDALSILRFLHTSPVSLIPKKSMGLPIENKFRMIHNASWGKLHGNSVNDGIPEEHTKCEYVTIKSVILDVIEEGAGCTLWKTDIVEAFKLIPMHPDDIPLLGFEIGAKEDRVHLETRLVFGVGSGPKIFSRFALALRTIFQRATNCSKLKNMLDDFFCVERDTNSIAPHLYLFCFQTFMTTMGVPLDPAKTRSPSTKMDVLGLEIDTVANTLSISETRLNALQTLLSAWEAKPSATKNELQSLLGVLSWCSFGVNYGRTFLRRIIMAIKRLPFQHSRWYLDASAKADVQWWIQFSPTYNGVSFIIDSTPVDIGLLFYTDASGRSCAAAWNDDWFHYEFDDDDRMRIPQIHHKEMFSIVMLCLTWGQRLQGKTILIYCDNEASVDSITAGRCDDPILMSMIRELFYIRARFSFQLKAVHIPGKRNTRADALSRPDKRHTAWTIRPSLNSLPTRPVIPSMTW